MVLTSSIPDIVLKGSPLPFSASLLPESRSMAVDLKALAVGLETAGEAISRQKNSGFISGREGQLEAGKRAAGTWKLHLHPLQAQKLQEPIGEQVKVGTRTCGYRLPLLSAFHPLPPSCNAVSPTRTSPSPPRLLSCPPCSSIALLACSVTSFACTAENDISYSTSACAGPSAAHLSLPANSTTSDQPPRPNHRAAAGYSSLVVDMPRPWPSSSHARLAPPAATTHVSAREGP
ncbi:hypothetical protein V8C26DRAFT_214511 [Trichoderma gracile]